MGISSVLLDRYGLQLDAYTWYRHGLTRRLLAPGPMRVLNIGTGGGMETLALLRLGNLVTTLEIDEETAARTRQRIERSGYSSQHVGVAGHILEARVEGQFHEILMAEVLEHISDDCKAIQRLSDWLLPGGRLILSTPTASYGQAATLSLQEDGGHVRVGYDGPELDEMLRGVGLYPLRRIYNGNPMVQFLHRTEGRLCGTGENKARFLLARSFSLLSRPLLPVVDVVRYRPYDQITLAIKKYWP